MICNDFCFNNGFEFQDYLCNDYQDVFMLSINIINIAIATAKNVDYSCIIHMKSKSEGLTLLENHLLFA